MKNIIKLVSITLFFLFALFACEKDDGINKTSKVRLDKLSVSGMVGETITAKVTFDSDVNKIMITKAIEGENVNDYGIEFSTASIDSYDFSQELILGDEKGTLVFSFHGYDNSGKEIDATDLLVKVLLTDEFILKRFDWKMVGEEIDGEDNTGQSMLDNYYRFNEDYSWELDWGIDPTLGEELTQYCAWKVKGTELDIDSIFLIKFGFLNVVPTIEGYKVTKLDEDNLWIQTTMDLSVFGYSSEARVLNKFIAQSKTPGFTPYRGRPAENYSWGPCTPGKY